VDAAERAAPGVLIGRHSAATSFFWPAQAMWAGVSGAPSWLAARTFVPDWLPRRLRHPLTGYVAALVIALLAVAMSAWLFDLDPDFRFGSLVIILAVVVVALAFGMGPSLFLALVGVGLIWFFVLPPQGTPLIEDIGDAVALLLLTAFALLMGILTSNTKQSQLDAETATRVRDTFLSLASHELRTPLTTLMLGSQLAQRHLRRVTSALQAPQRELARDLALDVAPDLEKLTLLLMRNEEAVARQDRLVDELLDVSRTQTGRLTFDMAPCDLTLAAQRATEEQRQQHPERAIRLELPASASASAVTVLADAQRIEQVVTNYLTNALKYSSTEQPVDVKLTVATGAATVSVYDHGQGLSADEQVKIWGLYHRAAGIGVVSGSGVGLGLGLYLCRSIVSAHHGVVGVYSEQGVGSTFWFTLPLLPGASNAVAPPARS
jgi:signal transduction histidine kinase